MPLPATWRFDAPPVERLRNESKSRSSFGANRPQSRGQTLSKIVGAFDQRDPSQRTRFSQVDRIPWCGPGCFFATKAAWPVPISSATFSAKAAYRCSMNGSASRPSSATMKGTRWAIRPATKATSGERRSSLATTTLHFAAFAAAS
jgi:hypothetical protein